MKAAVRYYTQTGSTKKLADAIAAQLGIEALSVDSPLQEETDILFLCNSVYWAGMVAHNGIVGVGRSQDWNSHGIEHELSALYDCAHGAGLAVIMPSWMEFVYEHDVMRFCQMATRVFGCQMNYENPKTTALEGISRFRSFLHSIGMPVNFEELGAREEDIPKLVEKLGVGDGKTGGFVELSSEDITDIYRIAVKASVAE